MIKYEEIREIHLELTERCQAECPMCPRTDNPLVGKRELSLANIESIFPEEFVKQLKTITICGNFGENVLAKDFIDIIQYFRFNNKKLFLKIYSNAGARDKDFWEDLAYLIGDMGIVLFGIDGLKDTNHIYRKNVQWDKVMRSAQSFIGAGGKAQWDFLVFEHNEHQVDEAKKLAKEIGFKSFRLRITNRWKYNNYDKSCNELQPSKIYKNEFLDKFESINSLETFYDTCKIDCTSINLKSLYISAEGLLFPCCWTGSQIYNHNTLDKRKIHIDLIGNKDNINIKLKSIKQILEEKHLEKYVQSWSKPSVKEGKLVVCSHQCNDQLNLFQSQEKEYVSL